MNRIQSLVLAASLVIGTHAAVAQNVRVHLGSASGPVAGASVILQVTGGSPITQSTDASGSTTFTGIAAGSSLECIASYTGLASCLFHGKLQPNDTWGEAAVTMGIWSSPLKQWRTGQNDPQAGGGSNYVTFHFYVKDSKTKHAVAGALITLTNKDGSGNGDASGNTDGNGEYTVPVAQNLKMSVVITMSGYKNYTTALAPGAGAQERDVRCMLRPGQ